MKKLFLLLILPMALHGAVQEIRQDTGTHKIIKPPPSSGALFDLDFSDVTTNISGGGGGGGTPGGSNTQFQYNNSLTFGGIPYTTYDGSAVTQMAGARYNLADTTDLTKKARIDVSLVPTGTTRIVTIASSANSVTVVPGTASTNNFLTGISSGGVLVSAQPAFSNISGTITLGQTSMASGFLLGRNTTSQGPAELISIGTGLTLGPGSAGSGGTLSSSAISTPGGTDTQFQFNDAGVFAGTAYLTYNTGIGRIFEQTGTRLRFTDNADTSKQMAIDMTGVTGGLTQTFKIPNANFVGVIGDVGTANNFLTGISPTTGVITKAQPNFTNLLGSLALSQTSMADSRLLGRNTGAGSGPAQEITLGTNLSFTGTTLNASGGSATPGGSDTQLQYNNAGTLGGITDWTVSGGIVSTKGSSFTIGDASDATARFNFNTSNIPTGTFEHIVVPNAAAPVIVAPDSGTANNFVTGISTLGVIGKAQPLFSNLGGTLSLSQTSMSTARLLGRSTIGTGVVEQISIGSNLTLAAGTLSASGGGTPGGSTTQIQYNNAGVFGGDFSFTTDGTSSFLRSDTTYFRDATDSTKQMTFALPNIPTGTTETVLVPNSINPVIVAADAGATNNFLTGITTLGVVTKAQPAFSNLSGVITMAQNKVLIGKELFVDSINGSDLSGVRGDLTKPFLTIPVALSWASAGDVLYVGPGIYAQGTTPLIIPAGITVTGAGADYTLITSAVTKASNRASVEGGTGGALSNVTIQNTAASGIPFGNGSSSAAFTLFSISGVKLIGISDGVSLSKAGTTGLQAENLYITTQGQCIEAAIGSSTFKASELIADGTATALARAIRVTNGTVIFRDGAITAGNSTTTNVAASATGSGSRIELHNVAIDRNATGVTNLDFEQASSAFLGIDNALRTDSFPPAMSGDITQIDRWDVKVTPIVSSATWSPVTTNSDDIFKVTAQAAAATTINNPAGTPADGQKLIFEIKDDGTSRAMTWSGSQWRAAGGLTLPAATTTGQWNYYGFVWNASDSKWDYIGSANPPASGVSDTAWASSWDGVTTTGPSKNAVYDWGHTFDTDDDGKVNVLDQVAGIVNTNSSGVIQTPLTAPSGALVGDTDTQTLTNKRVNPRVTTITSNAAWSPSADTDDIYAVTAQAAAATTINNPSGTPVNGQKLLIRYKDDGTARALTWSGSQWDAGPNMTLPTTTVVGQANYAGFVWNAVTSKWTLIASTQSGGGGSGSVTSITATSPIVVTPTPLTTTGVVSLDTTVDLALTAAQTVKLTDAVTNTVSTVLSLNHESSGTALAGYGTGLSFLGESDAALGRTFARIQGAWSDPTDATRTSYLTFATNNNATVTEAMRIHGSGGVSVGNSTDPTTGIVAANTGYRVGTAASTSGKILKSDGTKFTASTETYAAPGTSGNVLTSDGTNWTSAVATGGAPSDTAFASSWNGVTTVAPSKNAIYDELHLIDTADDGTIVNAGTGFRIGAAAGSNKVLKGNGTNFVASTETFAAPGTSGNVPTSDGTNWTSAAPVVTASNTLTFSNKRVTKRSLTLAAPTPAPTITADDYDVIHITGLSGAITSITMTGTPVEGDTLRMDFTDNGTARAITLGSSFEAGAVALPTTTVISTRLDVAFIWNTVTSKWRCMAQSGTWISDTAYGSAWNAVTTIAPSKNAIYDELHLIDTADDGTIVNAGTGFRIGAAAAAGKFLRGDGTNFIASVPVLPNAVATSGKLLQSDGTTGYIASTATWPTANTVGYLVRGDGTNYAAYPSEQINSSVTNQTPSTSDVYVTNSNVTVAAGDFKAKGQYRCSFDLVKSAGTGTIVISLRSGTAGTTSDTAQLTFTFPGAGTAVADTGSVDILVNWRTVGTGTSAVIMGYCKAFKNTVTAAGLWNTAVGQATIIGSPSPSSGFNSSTFTNMGISINGGTAFAGTITTVQAQLTQ